jgi:hypothetical protein
MKKHVRNRILVVLLPFLFGFGGYYYSAGIRGWPFANWLKNRPIIEYPSMLDLGSGERGKLVIRHFTIKNRGTSELIVNDIRTSCSCSGIERPSDDEYVRVDSIRLTPGESIDLRVRLALTGASIGTAMRSAIEFQTNDPNHPTGHMTLVVSNVSGGVYTTPRSVFFGTLPRGAKCRHVIDVRDHSIHPRTIARVSTTDRRVSAQIIPLPKVAESKRALESDGKLIGQVEIRVDTSSAGDIFAKLAIQLENESRPEEPVSITGKVVDSFQISPSVLFLPRLTSKGQVYTAKVVCRSTKGKDLSVRREAIPRGITAEVGPQDQVGSRLIQIMVDPKVVLPQSGQPLRVLLRAAAGEEETLLELLVHIR